MNKMMTTKNTKAGAKKKVNEKELLKKIADKNGKDILPTEDKPEKELKKIKDINKVCEGYGIPEQALLTGEIDYKKFGVKEEDKESINRYMKTLKEVYPLEEWDRHIMTEEEKRLVDMYGVRPNDIAEGRLDKLGVKEEDITKIEELFAKQYNILNK